MSSSGTFSYEYLGHARCDADLSEVHDIDTDERCDWDGDVEWWADPEIGYTGWDCPRCGTTHSENLHEEVD